MKRPRVPRSVKFYVAGVMLCFLLQFAATLIVGEEAAPSMLEQLGLSLIVPGIFVLGIAAMDPTDYTP